MAPEDQLWRTQLQRLPRKWSTQNGRLRNLHVRVSRVERGFEHVSGTTREHVIQLLRGLARRWGHFRLVAGSGVGHSDGAGGDNLTDASPCDASERRHKGQ